MNPRRRRPLGFSLLEVLVVVAIIAALAAVLLPSLRKARAATRKCACMSNLRQVGLGLQAYADSHRGSMPADPPQPRGQSTDRIRRADRPHGLGRLVPRYCPSVEIFFCPVDPYPELGLPAWRSGAPDVASHYVYRATDAGASEFLEKNTRRVVALGIMRKDRSTADWPGHESGIAALWGNCEVSFLKATYKQVNFNPITTDDPFIWADRHPK